MTIPPVSATAVSTAVGELVLPPGWRVDPSSVARLERLLRTVPPNVAGVVAPRRPLPPGTSFRTESERLSLAPPSWITEQPAGSVDGAVLVRPGIEARIVDDRVVVTSGALVVDLGALAHDPDTTPTDLGPAVTTGRPPFPWRPVVVLLAVDEVADPDDARRLANELIDLDIEARLALPMPVGGPLLTRPCTAEQRSIEALRPDVVIVLDAAGRAAVDGWCADNRATVVIDASDPGTASIEIIPWTVGHAQGRQRARLGRGADAGEVAALVNRLVSGPQPRPPTVPAPDATPVTLQPPHREVGRRPATLRSVGIVCGVLDDEGTVRTRSLARLLHDRGQQVTLEDAAAIDAIPPDTDLVLLHAVPADDAVRAMLRRRRQARRASVVDIAPRDLELHALDGRWTALTAEASELVGLAGAATTPSVAVRRAITALGIRAHRLPTLRTLRPDPASALPDDRPPRLGWHVGNRPHPSLADLDAVAAALAAVLDAHPTLALDLVGDHASLPSDLAARPDTRVLAEAGPADRAPWLLQVWTPWLPYADAADALEPFLAASAAGLPTVVAGANPTAAQGLAEPETTVLDGGDAQEWRTVIGALVAEPEERRGVGRRAAAAAVAFDPATAAATLDDLLAWVWP